MVDNEIIKSKRRISGRAIAGILLVIFGIGLILYPFASDWWYAQSQKHMRTVAKAKRTTPNNRPTKRAVATRKPEPAPQQPDGAIANLVIPKIGLDAYVVEGTTQGALSIGPGHYEETPLPPQIGNTAIAGHRTMHGHPFRNLDQLSNGDEIKLIVNETVFRYRVLVLKYVSPKDVSVIDPTTDGRLTLTTCAPVGSARQRLVVVAKLVKN